MRTARAVRWLHGELPRLTAAGVLDAAAAERLRRHYGEPGGWSGRRVALTVFSILGALLVGGGILLLLAHNWSALPRAARVVLAFAPLAAGQLLALRAVAAGRAGAGWREGAGTFLFLAVGTAIAMVSQIYHLPGDFDTFMLVWMLLGAALPYLLGAALPAVLYLAGVTAWAGAANNHLWVWPLFAVMAPYLVFRTRQHRFHPAPVAMWWAAAPCVAVALGFSTAELPDGLWIIAYAGFFAALYAAGVVVWRDAPGWWQRPLQNLGALGAVGLAFLLSWSAMWDDVTLRWYGAGMEMGPERILDGLVAAAMPAAALALGVTARRRRSPALVVTGLLPVLAVIGYALAVRPGGDVPAALLFSLYLLAAGVLLMAAGFRDGSLGRVNAGMLLVLLVAVARFFDSDLSLVARGVAFVILGAAFLTANLVLMRRRGGAR